MEIAKLKVDGVYAGVVMRRTVTAGLVGATIGVEYAAGIWEGLTKTVVFRGATTKDVVTNDTTIEIPWEVLTKPNERLQGRQRKHLQELRTFRLTTFHLPHRGP